MAQEISARADLRLVGEASDGATALALIEALNPDIALLDVACHALSGPEVAACLREQRGLGATRVILLSGVEIPAPLAR
jgi:two-component system nitrate/nitrite response regulator NarL